ncbi:MAG: dihydroorotate dehydrogenase-like protein [Anaerolineales bacterium]|nr:dihydroorotate dehydrogenase-like protein [Anaerolineales bacterium]
MKSVSTTYLGMELNSPLVASASPLTEKVETVKKLELAGAGAVVMPSLFAEQVAYEENKLDHFLNYGTESYAEATTYLPKYEDFNVGPKKYLDNVKAIKDAVSIPVIANLNGTKLGDWIEYAQRIEEAGADALEVNIYSVPTDVYKSSQEIEEEYTDLIKGIRQNTKFPIAVKMSQFFTSIPYMAKRIAESGADGLVMFNRFYQPDIDVESLELNRKLDFSTSSDLLLPLRWVAILYKKVAADFAITGGIHTLEDVLKATMSGAKVSMIASELLTMGIDRIPEILTDLSIWMEEHEYQSFSQMVGVMSQSRVAEPELYERANYMKVLHELKTLL